MTYAELRGLLEQILMEQIGSYVINDRHTPAIAGLDLGESLEDGRRVKGLEVILSRTPESRPRATFGGVQAVKVWQIFLVQWNEGPRSLEMAIDKLLVGFPGSTAVPLGLDQQREILAKVSVKLQDRDSYIQS